MRSSVALFLATSLALLMFASGCAVIHPPVPVVGDAEGVAALAGVWEGSYRSADTGRSGSIHFELVAEADSAVGEVVMTYFDGAVSFYPPDSDRWPRTQGPHVEVEVLTIRFVRLGAGRVSGTLDPYPEPDCGCTLLTTFEGTVGDEAIEGTFVARSPEHGHIQRGTWRVIRQS